MSRRIYTAVEIMRMRAAVQALNRLGPMQPYNQQELDARVEQQLQTYILSETNPDDLARVAHESDQARFAHYMPKQD